ncbi:hypothetical protein CEXT_78421 [Caerostris extrusa]|uniref:Uncharacterized protein n=1 Tax=Caerostris extrusa TaxID=172846 RepID=A0AAV4XHG5_CAEEX|nr:hypothetical protein CEXT_78421 [Caerostris extrusa]
MFEEISQKYFLAEEDTESNIRFPVKRRSFFEGPRKQCPEAVRNGRSRNTFVPRPRFCRMRIFCASEYHFRSSLPIKFLFSEIQNELFHFPAVLAVDCGS